MPLLLRDLPLRLILHRDAAALVLLLHHALARLVAVVLAVQRVLLRAARIVVAIELALVVRQRRTRRRRSPASGVHGVVAILPIAAPMLAPARRAAGMPAAEVGGRAAVVADRHPQDVGRHVDRVYVLPWPVVPGARVPAV